MFGPCILCRQQAEGGGAFIPFAPGLWGAPPGKDRVVFYVLCERCRSVPDVLTRVEAEVAKRNFPRVEAAT